MFPAELLMFNIGASCLRGCPADTTATNKPKKIKRIFVEPEEKCVKATLRFFLDTNGTFESFRRAVGLEPLERQPRLGHSAPCWPGTGQEHTCFLLLLAPFSPLCCRGCAGTPEQSLEGGTVSVCQYVLER